MKLPPEIAAELHTLLSAVCDGRATAADRNRLEALVLEHEAARDFYIEYIHLHAAVARYNLVSEPATPAPQRMLLRIGRHLAITPRLVGIAASLLLVGYFMAIVGLLAWDRIHRADDHEQIAAFSSADLPALLIQADDADWKQPASAKPADPFEPRTLRVRTGYAELKFAKGAKVVVEGPAEFEVRSASEGFLHHGKLVATVPSQAVGFTIETLMAKVVDLGTEFGVEANEQGATEVQVFKGKIELHTGGRASHSSRAQQPLTLSAGSAVRVEPGQAGGTPVARKIAATSNRLAQQGGLSKPRPIVVQGTVASSFITSEHISDNLINGRGLNGERHSAKSQGTMWHSSFEKVKNEYVLFDLAHPYRLELLKVWNYNEHFGGIYKWRGVKQADIYISNTSKGLPIDPTGDWQLVAADVEFAPADGTPDYSTPTLVPLGNVTARFVAIVIDEAWGHDPRTQFAEPDCAGLSEVQFFGGRVESSQPQTKQPEK